jgi:glycolate oxidase iron-sulfur subunit
MAYGHLFDLAREKLFQESPSKQPRNLLAVMGFKLIEHKSWLTAATIVMGLYQKIGLQFLIRKTGLLHVFKLKRAEALMPKVALTKLAERYPTAQQHRGNVALFTGCISDHFDRKTLLASIKLLNRIGFDVFVPKQQTCCGAIHLHQGQKDIADKMAALNTDVFNSLDIKAIIYTASGCGLTLTEYEHEKDDDQKFGNSLYLDVQVFKLRKTARKRVS